MEKGGSPYAHVGAAAVLATLTLAVFVASQGRSPQSAVLRLHEALVQADRPALDALFLNPGTPATKALEGEIFTLYRTSRSVQYGRIYTLGQASEVEVVYDSSIYGLRGVKFHLRKAPEGWKIDSRESLARTRESSLF